MSHFGRVHRHWKLLGLSVVLLIALVSSVYAYWKITTPTTPAFYVTATYPPLELRVQLDKTEFDQGEKITIRFSLRNLNNREAKITFSESGRFFEFRVIDKENSEVFTTLYWGAEQTTDDLTLASHGQLNEEKYWDQTSTVEGEYFKKQVTTGTYRIIGFTGFFLEIDQEKFTPAIRIEASPIPVTIS